MGELVIRGLDAALAIDLQALADRRGMSIEALASEMLASALRAQRAGAPSLPVARAVLARATPATVSATTLLDEIRDGAS